MAIGDVRFELVKEVSFNIGEVTSLNMRSFEQVDLFVKYAIISVYGYMCGGKYA